MLEIGRVVDTGGEHHDGRVGDVVRGRVAQRPQQMRGVVADRPHPMRGEQIREDPCHRAPVLHHVGDTGRRAQVVLEHPEIALGVADQVDACDVDAHPVGRGNTHRLAVKVLAGGDEAAGDDAVAQDLLLAVDVVKVCLERLDPLGDAALESRPLRRGDDSRHEVEGKRPLLAGQRERDALVGEGAAQRVGAGFQVRGIGRGKLGEDALVRSAHVSLGVEHLVEGLRVATKTVVTVEDAVVPFGRPRVAAGRSRGLGWQRSKAHPSHAAPPEPFRQASGPRFGRSVGALVP